MDFTHLAFSQLQKTLIVVASLLVIVMLLRLLFHFMSKRLYTSALEKTAAKRPRIQKRLDTLFTVLNSFITVIALVISVFLILGNFINLNSLLAGAGLIGLAVSFGAQSLIKDIITGLFFLFEDQFGVGDIVQIGNTTGEIIDITLRAITIRDFSGNVTTYGNSTITQITNLTKEWSKVDFTLSVATSVHIDTILSLLEEAAQKTKDNEKLKASIAGKPKIMGIETLGDGKMGVRIQLKTKAGRQFEVGRALRYNIKKLAEEKDITI